MKTVGVRALKQNASAVVAEAAAGEVVTITDRGRPVAQMVPLPDDHVAGLVVAGRARLPRRALSDLGAPAKKRPSDKPLSAVLEEMRTSDRY